MGGGLKGKSLPKPPLELAQFTSYQRWSYPLLYKLPYTSQRSAACTLILLLLPVTQLPEFVFNQPTTHNIYFLF